MSDIPDIAAIKAEAEWRGAVNAQLSTISGQMVDAGKQLADMAARKDESHNAIWVELRRVEAASKEEASELRQQMTSETSELRQQVVALATTIKVWGGIAMFCASVIGGLVVAYGSP